MKISLKLFIPLLCSSLFVACGHNDLGSSSTDQADSSSSAAKAAPGAVSIIREGFLSPTANGSSLDDSFSALAQLKLTQESSTIEIYAWGLTPDSQYMAHIHSGRCGEGGPHYLQDPDGEDIAENGLWPMIMTDSEGYGEGSVTQEFVVSEEAASIMLHDHITGVGIACGNLNSSGGLMGTIQITSEGQAIYESISGAGYLSVHSNGWSEAEVTATGLTPGADYHAHLHLGSCAAGGGGHYLQDPDGEDDATNGLWPDFSVDDWGYAVGWVRNPFMVRLDEAKSLYIHETEDGTRLACIGLQDKLLAYRSGDFAMTEAGEALYGGIDGRARLYISDDGLTVVELYLSGLSADLQYMSHIHTGTCADTDEGHYLQDLDGADDAENGVWPMFMSNADGTAVGSIIKDFIVRPDASSLVVHDPLTKERIACADLD